MKIYYSPFYHGYNSIDLGENGVCLDTQVLETQGLLSQLALHAGIHQEICSYARRLADYHQAMMYYDKASSGNIFHRSIAIDSMSVAKTLLGWRDTLSWAGWNASFKGISNRLDALADIEVNYQEMASDFPLLLSRLSSLLSEMKEGKVKVPTAYREMSIIIPFSADLLPDYIKPLLDCLKSIGVTIQYDAVNVSDKPKKMEILRFTQQYQAEAWLSQVNASDYDVWINSDNKRLDNWLHMAGKPVAGSDMRQCNPQVTQMFLLAIQLFQRPLNVSSLLQYLYLPECPLPWHFTSRLASTIVREGGFCSEKVLDVINNYLNNDLNEEGDEASAESTPEERKKIYLKYIPFDFHDQEQVSALVSESNIVDVEKLKTFLGGIKSYAANRAIKISAFNPSDLKIAQLLQVSSLIDSLLSFLPSGDKEMPFKTLQQWAQSLYEASDFKQFNAQVGSQLVISSPASMVNRVKNTIWCDFYGDVSFSLSTDFLSPKEIGSLSEAGVRLWNPEHEKEVQNVVLETPLHQTENNLVFVVCEKNGSSELPIHPLRLQLSDDITVTDGDKLFAKLKSQKILRVDNHREDDKKSINFDAHAHEIKWRDVTSFSALDSLLQNPLDYFMNYILGFSDLSATEIKMSLTNGNVAHEVIENLFTSTREKMSLAEYVKMAYEKAFDLAVAKKGALLLLPEHHLELDKLKHLLQRCVNNLAEIIESNELTVVKCEQEETQDLGFDGGVLVKGYIDMLLTDKNGKNVIFDLKWTSKKDKHKMLIQKNRAAQLAIYKAMLQKHEENTDVSKTAFFVMPMGSIVSSDQFEDKHFVHVGIDPLSAGDIMGQLRKGYEERRKQISDGYIETSDGFPFCDIPYAGIPDVFPLEAIGVKPPKKVENKYSDYKCFTL